MRIAMLAPIAWRTPPPLWTLGTGHPPPDEALVARGIDVTLFATRNSLATAKLDGVVPAP